MEPLKEFICDTCNQPIENIGNGAVEWVDDKETSLSHGFRICHSKERCYKHSRKFGHSSVSLSEFTGENGHIWLLKFIDIGPNSEPVYSYPRIKDFREYTELFRRLTIPHYEEARQWWNEATSDGYLDGYESISIYQVENLKRMIEYYGK